MRPPTAKPEEADMKDLFLHTPKEQHKQIRAFESIDRIVEAAVNGVPANEEVALYSKAVANSRHFLGKGRALSLTEDASAPKQTAKLVLAYW